MTGSCWEYSENNTICHEDSTKLSRENFSMSKIKIYKFLKRQCDENNVKLIWFRIFYMYGPHQKNQSLIPTILNDLSNNRKPSILNPNKKNDFIYVGDVCNAIIKSIHNQKVFGIYNLGYGKTFTVLSVYKLILKYFNLDKSNKYKIRIQKKTNKRYILSDIKKIYRDLGWSPKINLVQGIKKTINYKL